jgi:hypothetical protein
VSQDECTTEAGFVIHRDGRKLGYGALAAEAAQMGDVPGVDADCVRSVYETLSAQDLVAIGESGGDVSSPAYADFSSQLMACATGETSTTG